MASRPAPGSSPCMARATVTCIAGDSDAARRPPSARARPGDQPEVTVGLGFAPPGLEGAGRWALWIKEQAKR